MLPTASAEPRAHLPRLLPCTWLICLEIERARAMSPSHRSDTSPTCLVGDNAALDRLVMPFGWATVEEVVIWGPNLRRIDLHFLQRSEEHLALFRQRGAHREPGVTLQRAHDLRQVQTKLENGERRGQHLDEPRKPERRAPSSSPLGGRSVERVRRCVGDNAGETGSSSHWGQDAGRQRASIGRRRGGRRAQRAERANAKLSCPLGDGRRSRGGRRTRAEAVLGEQPGDGLGSGGGLDPAHRPRAAAAVLDVGEEDVPDEPAPAGSTEARRVSVGWSQWQALLIAGAAAGVNRPGSGGAVGVTSARRA